MVVSKSEIDKKKVDFKSKTNTMFLILSIILGFIFIISFSTLYVSNVINQGEICSCPIPIPYMILILSSLGFFIGFLLSFILNNKYEKEKNIVLKNINFTLNFLNLEEKKIIEILIKNKGTLNQSKIENLTNLHRVKIHRLLKKLEEKKLIEKIQNKKTNIIKLNQKLSEIFIK